MTRWYPPRMRLHKSIVSALCIGALVTFYSFSASTTALAQSSSQAGFYIPEQPLSAALKAFADQAGMQLLYRQEDIKGLVSHSIAGKMSKRDALEQLLQGTTLEIVYSSENAATIREKGSSRSSNEKKGAQASTEIETPLRATPAPFHQHVDAPEQMEGVIVTGTRIRGAEQASPVVTINQDDMRMQGQTDLGQVARALPQNFAGGQNPGISLGAGGINNQNITGSSSLNLRGLGQDATLTLLNGARLPYDGFTQATDVAMVPIAAIDRVEVLLDGASAIYGSDAVGGVVNLILKRDYNGAEVSARWGEATNGGFLQHQYTGIAGTTWSTGGFMVTADYNQNSGVVAAQRNYLSALPADMSIYPSSKQTGGLLSGHQRIGENVELTVDAFYTKRKGDQFADFADFAGYSIDARRDTTIWGIAPALRLDLPNDWSLRFSAALGENEADSDQIAFLPGGTPLFRQFFCQCNDAKSVSVDSEGPLFSLPGGEARLAFGGGWRGNKFRSTDLLAGTTTTEGSDNSRFVYGEIYLPLISEQQEIPVVHQLSISGAARHEDYNSFGGTTTPKFGMVWGLTRDIEFKASWGRSFKVPTLLQQYDRTTLDLLNPAQLGGTAYPIGSGAFFLQGGNPGLTPERARTSTAGFAIHPESLPGLHLDANWFDINYTNRIVQPFNSIQLALSDASNFGFVTFNPTVADQNAAFTVAGQAVGTFFQGTPPPPIGPYDPSRIVAIVNDRYVNSAAQHVHGVDLSASYAMDLLGGSFNVKAAGTWLKTTQKLTALAPDTVLTGFVFYPAEYRWRIGGLWSKGGLALSTTVNQTGGVRNNLFPGDVKGDSFTTVDVALDYVLKLSSPGSELQFDIGVQNFFNQRPPYMQPVVPVYVSYDSTNYSPLGRVVNFTLTRRF